MLIKNGLYLIRRGRIRCSATNYPRQLHARHILRRAEWIGLHSVKSQRSAMPARPRVHLSILQQFRQLHQRTGCFPHDPCVVVGSPRCCGVFICTLDSRNVVGAASIPVKEGKRKDQEILWRQWRVCKVRDARTRWCKRCRLFRWSEHVTAPSSSTSVAASSRQPH